MSQTWNESGLVSPFLLSGSGYKHRLVNYLLLSWRQPLSPASLIKPRLIVSLAGEEGPLCLWIIPRRAEARWRWESGGGGGGGGHAGILIHTLIDFSVVNITFLVVFSLQQMCLPVFVWNFCLSTGENLQTTDWIWGRKVGLTRLLMGPLATF